MAIPRASKGTRRVHRQKEAVHATVRRSGDRDRGPHLKVFEFLREPANLPRWAHAFVSAGNGRARLETPAGAVDVALGVTVDAETGVVDWRLAFPDGSIGIAQSRVTQTTRGTCIYSFVLHAPPIALELEVIKSVAALGVTLAFALWLLTPRSDPVAWNDIKWRGDRSVATRTRRRAGKHRRIARTCPGR